MKLFFLLPFVALSGCATMNDSLELGASMGTLVGGVGTFAAKSAGGHNPSVGDLAIGSGIGLAVGVLTAYLTHQAVEDQRQSSYFDQTQMHFGDLPPSPFMIPKNKKKGGR